MKKIVILIFFSSVSLLTFAQKESGNVRAGNKLYNNKKYTEAEIEYRKGLEVNKNSFEATFNLGNALYKQGKMDEAMEQYLAAAALQQSESKKVAAAFHNLGNAFMNKKEYQKSIDAYKIALKNNPNDNETRYNYAYAKAMLKKQQEQKQNEKKNDINKEQKKQEQQQQSQPKPNPDKMSKENAQQILNAFMQDEKNVQEKVKKQEMNQLKKYRAEKDW